jgi:hypothetical protein
MREELPRRKEAGLGPANFYTNLRTELPESDFTGPPKARVGAPKSKPNDPFALRQLTLAK